MDLVKRYIKDDFDWNIGSLFSHDAFVWNLIKVCQELKVNHRIKYVFGSIPCKLQGGRIPTRTADIKDAIDILDKYNELGISCRLTFSNCLIDEEDFEDDVSNQLLKRIDDNNKKYHIDNGVIISLDELAKYIKDKYKSLSLIASQVKPSVEVGLGKDTVEYYNKLFDLYDIVVVNPFKVCDGGFIHELKHHDRVEFIVNHRCLPNCLMAGKHYKAMMKMENMDLPESDRRKAEKSLNRILSVCSKTRRSYPLAGDSFSESDINLLMSEGFKHFKIEGRDNSGTTFVRDLGDYVFVNNVLSRISHAILDGAV